MKSYFFMSVVAASLLLNGCSGSSDSDNNVDDAYTVTVERGPIWDANVTDAQGNVAVEDGSGKYIFESEPEYPIRVEGGYIDVNRNGTIDAGEVENTLVLESSEGSVVTLATTLMMSEENLVVLEELYGLTKEDIANQTPSTSQDIEAFSNALYAYSIENGVENPSEIDVDALKVLVSDYQERQEVYRNDTDGNVSERESALINALGMETLDEESAAAIRLQLEEKLNSQTTQDETETEVEVTNDNENNNESESDTQGKVDNDSEISQSQTTEN